MCTSKTVITFCQWTWHHISEDHSLFLIHYHGNLKSHICCSHWLGLSYIFGVCVLLTHFSFTLSTPLCLFPDVPVPKFCMDFFVLFMLSVLLTLFFLLNPVIFLDLESYLSAQKVKTACKRLSQNCKAALWPFTLSAHEAHFYSVYYSLQGCNCFGSGMLWSDMSCELLSMLWSDMSCELLSMQWSDMSHVWVTILWSDEPCVRGHFVVW